MTTSRSARGPRSGLRARPLKRFLQHQLETRIERALIAGEVSEGSVVDVGMEDGSLEVTIRPAESAVSA